jgi:hypothetical protein
MRGFPHGIRQVAHAGAVLREVGLVQRLDMNGDGNPLDDVLNMAGTFMRAAPSR